MNRFFLVITIILICFSSTILHAQKEVKSKSKGGVKRKERDTIKTVTHKWKLTENNDLWNIEIDTALCNFQTYNPLGKNSISSSHLGNLGLANKSNIYFGGIGDTTFLNSQHFIHNKSDFLLIESFSDYLMMPDDCEYYNTTKPFTDLSYSMNGKKQPSELTLNFLHTQNVTKNFNVGIKYNLISSDGLYQAQRTSLHSVGMFTSFINHRYSLHSNFTFNKFKFQESGGVDKNAYDESRNNSEVLDANIPIYLSDAKSFINSFGFLLVQKYSLGKKKIVKFYDNDSIIETFTGDDTLRIRLNKSLNIIDSIPYFVFKEKSNISHRFEIQSNSRRYTDNDFDTAFYSTSYYNDETTYDSVYYRTIRNKLEWRLSENKDKKFRMGANIAISNELNKYYNFIDYINTNSNPNTTFSNNYLSGGIFSKTGRKWMFNINGKFCFAGRRSGDFRLFGDLKKIFGSDKNKSVLYLSGLIENTKQNFLTDTYYANNLRWINNFSNEQKLLVKAAWQIPSANLSLGFDATLISNYVYFDTQASPTVEKDAFSVFSAYIGKDFHLGKFHLVNKIIYQGVSDTSVISLPVLTAFNSLYFQHTIFSSVMKLQIGFDTFFNTPFYSPAYMPASGLFHQQRETKSDIIPRVDFFINAKLKRVRMFFKFINVSNLFTDEKCYSAHNYMISDTAFRFGISWRFHN